MCLKLKSLKHLPQKNYLKKSKTKIKKDHLDNWIKKPQHGFLMRTREQVTNIDDNYTNKWMKTSTFSSHVEGYICAIQEEEIFTRALEVKRKEDSTVNPNCRLCGSTKETIQHIIASCPRLSASMYLPVRHNKVAYVVYQYLVDKHNDIYIYIYSSWYSRSIH